MREKELSEEHSPSDVKQALAIASKMGGNMTGATAAIEKKRKGLSKHKQVAAVLKRANEEVKEDAKEKFEPHMMYDPKTGEGKHAKVEKDHLDMKAKGWGHDKPKAKDIKVKEGLGDEAHLAEQDHEVQMARAELYKLAKYAIKLHEMLKGISERDGLEGWVQSKITKSADMIGSVYHHLEYQESPMGEVTESACNCDCGKAICESCGKAHKVSESGLQAYIGNKKYGEEGMKKLRQAGRDGGGEEAKGKIKDKILGKKTESYKESLASKLAKVQQQRKAVAEDLAPTKDQLKGKELDALRNKNVAKMRKDDEAAKKTQRAKFDAAADDFKKGK